MSAALFIWAATGKALIAVGALLSLPGAALVILGTLMQRDPEEEDLRT